VLSESPEEPAGPTVLEQQMAQRWQQAQAQRQQREAASRQRSAETARQEASRKQPARAMTLETPGERAPMMRRSGQQARHQPDGIVGGQARRPAPVRRPPPAVRPSRPPSAAQLEAQEQQAEENVVRTVGDVSVAEMAGHAPGSVMLAAAPRIRLDAAEAVKAVIYAEILATPKCLRHEPEMWER
jgi:hypothetical protein